MGNLKIESLRYISLNKVRIASFRYKCDKEIIKDYLYLISNTDMSESLMTIGITAEDIKRLDEQLRWKKQMDKLISCAADNCLIKKEYIED